VIPKHIQYSEAMSCTKALGNNKGKKKSVEYYVLENTSNRQQKNLCDPTRKKLILILERKDTCQKKKKSFQSPTLWSTTLATLGSTSPLFWELHRKPLGKTLKERIQLTLWHDDGWLRFYNKFAKWENIHTYPLFLFWVFLLGILTRNGNNEAKSTKANSHHNASYLL
jgi:hypothetical protein